MFLTISNYVFTVIFVAEMTVKVLELPLDKGIPRKISVSVELTQLSVLVGGGPWLLQLSTKHMECVGWGSGVCFSH